MSHLRSIELRRGKQVSGVGPSPRRIPRCAGAGGCQDGWMGQILGFRKDANEGSISYAGVPGFSS